MGMRKDRDSDTELWAWHAPDPFGAWTAHVANPLKIDVTSSRPAGTPFVRDGVLYRPAQDGSHGYGAALSINQVVRLDELDLVEASRGARRALERAVPSRSSHPGGTRRLRVCRRLPAGHRPVPAVARAARPDPATTDW